jgi:hypothetical protein
MDMYILKTGWRVYKGGQRMEVSSRRLSPSDCHRFVERGAILMVYVDTRVIAAYYCPEALSLQDRDLLREHAKQP